MRVPYLHKDEIALAADRLIAAREARTGAPVTAPVPVASMIEEDLGLRLGFTDFQARFNMAGVLGATFVGKRTVLINEALLGQESEGRMAFTCAHEAGHWVLHRKLVRGACRSETDAGTIFCRSREAKKPIEWQADYFAGCLLMPAALVAEAFCRVFRAERLELHNVEPAFDGPACFDPCLRTWPRIAEAVRGAGDFSNVSKQALIIRLQELGLVQNHTGRRAGWGRG